MNDSPSSFARGFLLARLISLAALLFLVTQATSALPGMLRAATAEAVASDLLAELHGTLRGRSQLL